MYWRQIAFALSSAVATVFYLNQQGYSSAKSVAAGVLVYFVTRWLIAWVFRIRYWYSRGTRGIYTRSCANCGQYIYRKSGDWILKCHRCGWKAGLPVTQWFTKSVPSIQIRRTIDGPQLVVVVVAAAVTLAGAPAIPQDFGSSLNAPSPVTGDGGSQPTVQEYSTDQRDTPTQIDEETFNRTKVERYVWEFTNEERSKNGLSRIEYAPRIVEPARNHARNMAEHDYVGHTQPNGETMKERYSSVCRYPGENAIGAWYERNYEDRKTGNLYYSNSERELAKHLVARWMNSTGHRENILRSRWNELGVGLYKRDDGKVFVAQTFC